MRGKANQPEVLRGRPLSPGTAVGTAHRVAPRVAGFFRLNIAPREVERELESLDRALQRSLRQLYKVRDRLEAKVGREHSFIIDAHLMILEDGRYLEEIKERIREDLQSPERAVRETTERWLDLYRGLDDPFFREKGSDLEEVSERILRNLGEAEGPQAEQAAQDLVLVAPSISLLVLTQFRLERVKALVLSQCGHTSHVSIICRSCRIPVVTGIDNPHQFIRSGDMVAVDGTHGMVHVRPPAEALDGFLRRERLEQAESRALEGDQEPCFTADERRIRVLVNTEVGREVEVGLRLGGEGIGLFRTESIYAGRQEEPVGEDEQYEIYSDLAKRSRGRTAIVRTLDIGDEEHPYFSGLAGVKVPLLGLRGIRLSLRHPEIFRAQVRAILRARRHGGLSIALPMLTSLSELRRARSIIARVQDDLGPPPAEYGTVEVGAMLEVPAAIIEIESLAAEADFLLVGSNDLIQFLLAVSRTDETVADLYDPCHPSVIACLHRIAQAAEKRATPAIVCGEVATDPEYAPLLVGMGFSALSMNPFAIPDIKSRLRQTSYRQLRPLVERLLSESDSDRIREQIGNTFQSVASVSDSR